jgi:hypothetical protein
VVESLNTLPGVGGAAGLVGGNANRLGAVFPGSDFVPLLLSGAALNENNGPFVPDVDGFVAAS